MPTIHDSARFAQWCRLLSQIARTPRAAAWRRVVLVAIAGAAYLPGVIPASAPLTRAPVSTHAAIAVAPQLPCPGMALPC